METKFFVINNDNFVKTLPDLQIKLDPKSQTEIPGDFARILVRQFEVRKVTIESGKEIDNVNYREFLDNSNKVKMEENKTIIEDKPARSSKKSNK